MRAKPSSCLTSKAVSSALARRAPAEKIFFWRTSKERMGEGKKGSGEGKRHHKSRPPQRRAVVLEWWNVRAKRALSVRSSARDRSSRGKGCANVGLLHERAVLLLKGIIRNRRPAFGADGAPAVRNVLRDVRRVKCGHHPEHRHADQALPARDQVARGGTRADGPARVATEFATLQPAQQLGSALRSVGCFGRQPLARKPRLAAHAHRGDTYSTQCLLACLECGLSGVFGSSFDQYSRSSRARYWSSKMPERCVRLAVEEQKST